MIIDQVGITPPSYHTKILFGSFSLDEIRGSAEVMKFLEAIYPNSTLNDRTKIGIKWFTPFEKYLKTYPEKVGHFLCKKDFFYMPWANSGGCNSGYYGFEDKWICDNR